jgi:hypothetical protein
MYKMALTNIYICTHISILVLQYLEPIYWFPTWKSSMKHALVIPMYEKKEPLYKFVILGITEHVRIWLGTSFQFHLYFIIFVHYHTSRIDEFVNHNHKCSSSSHFINYGQNQKCGELKFDPTEFQILRDHLLEVYKSPTYCSLWDFHYHKILNFIMITGFFCATIDIRVHVKYFHSLTWGNIKIHQK